MEKLSSRRVGRLKHYDPLLQKVYKPKKSSKQAGKRRMKLRANHATRGDALAQLQEALKLNSRKQVMQSIIPGAEPVLYRHAHITATYIIRFLTPTGFMF